jgi:hypothetical protein
MAAVDSPGYLEVFTASKEEIAALEPGTERFYWNIAKSIRNKIVSGEGESKSWRETVIYLIGERIWEKLLRRQGGEPYGTLSRFVREGLEITVQQFVEGVARYAGPDAVDLLKPHLPEITRDGLAPDPQEEVMGLQRHCNNDVVDVGGSERQEGLTDRRIAAAPELAIRLYTQKLLDKEHLIAIGRLALEGRHNEAAQETLELLLDRIDDMDKPPVTATSTERRHFREELRPVIQALIPPPESQQKSKPVRLPNDPVAAAAWLKRNFSPEDLAVLCQSLCSDSVDDLQPAPAAPRNRKSVEALAVGSFVSLDQVNDLTGEPISRSTQQHLVSKIKANPDDDALRLRSGNGWTFRKRTGEEMVQLGYTDRSPSWEVIERG